MSNDIEPESGGDPRQGGRRLSPAGPPSPSSLITVHTVQLFREASSQKIRAPRAG